MITIYKELGDCKKYEMKLTHGKDVFDEARKIFYNNENVREDMIAVQGENREILYYLKYDHNQVDPLIYVDPYWDYNIYDENIDFELLDRGQVFIFLELEEYTYQIARIIQMHYLDKEIFFTDKKASLFFCESERLHIVSSINEIYNCHRDCISKTMMTIDSKKEFLHNEMRFIIKRYRSLSVMTSLFWKCNRMSFGNENPDKTFFLIKNTLDVGGMADLIKFTLYRVAMAKEKGLIPVIDLSVKGDNNQYNNGDGTNAWTMFFEQITDIPLEEVYRSKNVVISRDKMDIFNPYILEQHYFMDLQQACKKYLKFNEKVTSYISKMYYEKIPNNKKKILGVIGRGTDYHSNRAMWICEPLETDAFLEEVAKAFEEWNCEYIFLATEDENVFKAFMGSNLRDKIISVDQERIDYNDAKYKNLWLAEIKVRDKTGGYIDNLRYLGILWILSKCSSLISSVSCGSSKLAIAFNIEKYDNVKIFSGDDSRIFWGWKDGGSAEWGK